MIGRYTEQALLKRAKEVVEEKGKGSAIFDEEAEKAVPRFKSKGECTSYLLPTLHIKHSFSNQPSLTHHYLIIFIRA